MSTFVSMFPYRWTEEMELSWSGTGSTGLRLRALRWKSFIKMPMWPSHLTLYKVCHVSHKETTLN